MISKDRFVHLHLHSDYSMLDGAIKIDRLMPALHARGMHAVAVTDHGGLFATIEFYKTALKNDIKPIIGQEFYISHKPIKEDEDENSRDSKPYHLVLLAESTEGYKNLLKLSSMAYLKGFYYKPRIDKDMLSAHSKGLIGLSACLKGEINVHISDGNMEAARIAAGEYLDILGKNNFYIELMRHGINQQEINNKALVELAAKLDIGVVATNDCHYLEKEDAEAHDVLLCIQTNSLVSDENRMQMPTPEFYLKSADEMATLFKDLPQALENTVRIAERCNVMIEMDRLNFPAYHPPEGSDLDSYLQEVASRGLESIYEKIIRENQEINPDELKKIYTKRLQDELAVIRQTGFAAYFLIVWDFIRFARESDIPVGPGRGSGAGSLVAYVMRITDIDPIKYGLLFQRFLNPERITPPDFDIDFCWRKRPKVIDYVKEKYGKDNVAQIITFGTLGAKAAIKDVARAMNIPFDEANRINKMIPDELNITIEAAIKKSPDFKELYDRDLRVRKVVDIAMKLEGLVRHASIHAAGVVITPGPLDEYVPLYRSTRDEITTQFAMNEVESIGLLKMDFLGLRTLTVIDDALNLIKTDLDEKIDLDNIPLGDDKTFALFQRADTSGIFQFESSGMRDILRKVQPTQFSDLIALNALYRPGPLGSGMIDDYIKRKHGKVKITYLHPDLEKYLSETYGVIVYQEQVMQIASALGGFSLGDADLLRRAMGKKKEDVMAAQEKRFTEGAKTRGVKPATAKKIFELMSHFAGYGFNKSHSTAYALLAYQTAYLKAHYPVHFMAALLTSEKENLERVAKYIQECKEMNVPVAPPDINKSYSDFTVKEGKILFGLSAIKNVGEKAVELIIRNREEEGPFQSIFDFCRRVGTRTANKRVIENFIYSGSMDAFLKNRASLYHVLDTAIEMGQRYQQDMETGQLSIFDDQYDDEELFRKLIPSDFKEWSEKEVLEKEKESLGFYVTGHPLSAFEEDILKFSNANCFEAKEMPTGTEVIIGGMILNIRKIFDKREKQMATAVLEDLYSSVGLLIFSSVFDSVASRLQSEIPVIIKGKVDNEGNETRILVNEISLLPEFKEKETKHVLIKVMMPGIDDDYIKKLEDIFKKHKGKARVTLELIRPQDFTARIELNEFIRVKPGPEFIRDIEMIIGENSVTFIE